jgi:hypothetical protein
MTSHATRHLIFFMKCAIQWQTQHFINHEQPRCIMAFYQYDDRTKDRDFEDDSVAAFLSNGGKVTGLPDSKTAIKLQRRHAANQARKNKPNPNVLFDFSK